MRAEAEDPLAGVPHAHGGPAGCGRIRVEPEDFEVEELLGFEPEGAGEHVWLRVEKRDADTAWVARRLARAAGLAPRTVAWAGLKDRRAVARQWFSVHLPAARPVAWERHAEGRFRVLAATRHRRRLRRGGLRGNRFRIRVRELAADRRAVAARLAQLAQAGVPNLFGRQRFGREGANLAAAMAWFAGGAAPRDRHLRGLLLSAARAHLFNRIAAVRIADGTWERILPGEAVALEGSRSVFAVAAPDAALERRRRRGDVHPTAALWGRGEPLATGAVRRREAEVAAVLALLRDGLEAAGLVQERRALRVLPRALRGVWEGPRTLRLEFTLPAGAYATAVLRELVAAEGV